MTGILFDFRDSGGSGKMACHPRLRLRIAYKANAVFLSDAELKQYGAIPT